MQCVYAAHYLGRVDYCLLTPMASLWLLVTSCLSIYMHVPVTQDNTPPGPIFKARLLRTKINAAPNRVLLERSRRQLSENVSFSIEIILGAE